MYCKYCGRKIQEGEICNCRSQNDSVKVAVRKISKNQSNPKNRKKGQRRKSNRKARKMAAGIKRR